MAESSVDPYLFPVDVALTKDDLVEMEERLLRVIKHSNRRSRERRHSSRAVNVVGDNHMSGYSGTRFTGSSHGSQSKSDKIEIIIKGAPSTAYNGHDDVYCYPNCHSNCYPHCDNHPAAQAWSYYQPPSSSGHCATCGSRKTDTVYSSHGSHLSAAFQAPVAASLRSPRKEPKTRDFSVQMGSPKVVPGK